MGLVVGWAGFTPGSWRLDSADFTFLMSHVSKAMYERKRASDPREEKGELKRKEGEEKKRIDDEQRERMEKKRRGNEREG